MVGGLRAEETFSPSLDHQKLDMTWENAWPQTRKKKAKKFSSLLWYSVLIPKEAKVDPWQSRTWGFDIGARDKSADTLRMGRVTVLRSLVSIESQYCSSLSPQSQPSTSVASLRIQHCGRHRPKTPTLRFNYWYALMPPFASTTLSFVGRPLTVHDAFR